MKQKNNYSSKIPGEKSSVTEKLLRAREYLRPKADLSINEIAEILQKRASQMAKKEKVDDKGNYIEIVKFVMDKETYGIETNFIQEVYQLKDMAIFPCMPKFMTGIINMRGRLITIIDLKKVFELPGKGLSEMSKAIIIRSGKREFGILADRVLGIEKIDPLSIQKSLPTLQGIQTEYLKGITDKYIVLLDAVKLLADTKLLVNEQV